MQIKGFNHSTKNLVELMKAHGATEEHTKSISFEALVVHLRDNLENVISLSKACLQRINYLCAFRHGSPSAALVLENVNVRVFLAVIMIAYSPTHVFQNMGTSEQALFDATVPLIKSFERICNSLLSSETQSFAKVPHKLTKDFPTLIFDFLKK